MNETNEFLEAIRSLNCEFRVIQRDLHSIELALAHVVLAGAEGPFILRFTSPRGEWAMEWDVTHSRWTERPDLSRPDYGMIVEAFVKQVPNGYTVSFSDRREPLVRWGLTAGAISIRSAIRGDYDS